MIAIYALLATAYSLIYGLVGRINLAFGDLSSLAGYGAFLGFSLVGDKAAAVAVAIALVAGLFTAAMHGTALGQLVIARLAQAPGQHILIATIGVSIFWQEAMRLTQGAGNRWISPLINRPIGIARTGDFTVTVTPMAVIVVVVAGVAASALVIAMRRLRFGLRWRASADDPIAAAMLGIDQRAILVRTFVLAALLAGLGGVLMTLALRWRRLCRRPGGWAQGAGCGDHRRHRIGQWRPDRRVAGWRDGGLMEQCVSDRISRPGIVRRTRIDAVATAGRALWHHRAAVGAVAVISDLVASAPLSNDL